MHLVSRFPCVVHIWVPFPLDEVLEHSGLTKASMIDDTLYFVFFFPFKENRWRPGIVGFMLHAFMIRRQKGCMEDIMYVSGCRET
jgi:hypothetical protein